MPRRTPYDEAAAAVVMSEMGFQNSRISDAVGIPRQTVDDIVKGRHGWDAILRDNETFRRHRDQQKRILHAGSLAVAQKALKRVDETVEQASPGQAAMIYGIMRDKERLDAGEPTSIEAKVSVEQVEILTRAQLKIEAILAKRANETTREP